MNKLTKIDRKNKGVDRMKKKYIIPIIAIIITIVSATLFIKKPSYAIENACPYNITVTADTKTTSFIQSGNNKIALPSNINFTQNPEDNNSNPIFLTLNGIFDKYIYKDTSLGEESAMNNVTMTRRNTSSILMGYLINDTSFSTNKEEDNYYKQLLILWALDRLEGYDDKYNYSYDFSEGGIVTSEKETNYEDKFEIIGIRDKNVHWKFNNRLSAGDKEMLKNSSVGDKMEEYLKEWDEYVDWYIEDNQMVELNPITKEDITYHVTNDYIETNLITPTSVNKIYKDKFAGYKVEVSAPTIVVNSKGEEQTEFLAGEGFKVRIPIDEIINKSIDFQIKIQGYFDFQSVQIYHDMRPTRAQISGEKESLLNQLTKSSFVQKCTAKERKEAEQIVIEFNQPVGNLNIKVIDAETKENLAKAKIEIYDKSGNIIYRYETTNSELNITLPVGEYTVKQIVTPPNYQARVVEQKVTITENGETDAVLENIQLVEVPDTLKKTTTITILGIIVTLLGLAVIITIITKRKKKV